MPADKWIETYRGTVFRWEVDDNDHFTVAYYLARIGDASVAMLHALGTGSGAHGGLLHSLSARAPHRRHHAHRQRGDRRRAPMRSCSATSCSSPPPASCAPPSSSASPYSVASKARRGAGGAPRRLGRAGPRRPAAAPHARRLPRQSRDTVKPWEMDAHRASGTLGGCAPLLGVQRPRARHLRRHAGVHARVAPWLLDLRVPARAERRGAGRRSPGRAQRAGPRRQLVPAPLPHHDSTSAAAPRWRAWSSRACTSTRRPPRRP